ncbi:hypothetical protein BTVI_151153 [Pitangus sulphuratus]|nr:hypothetical protein BTVI_151153 [Pitangus sulphuratus]
MGVFGAVIWLRRFTESRNRLGWKTPLRSWSPTYNRTPPGQPRHVTKCRVQSFLKTPPGRANPPPPCSVSVTEMLSAFTSPDVLEERMDLKGDVISLSDYANVIVESYGEANALVSIALLTQSVSGIVWTLKKSNGKISV